MAFLQGGQWTVSSTAASVRGALSIPDVPERTIFSKVTVKNADGAANAMYCGRSNVTNTPANACIELGAGDSYTFGGKEAVNINEIFMVGTANAANIAFIALE